MESKLCILNGKYFKINNIDDEHCSEANCQMWLPVEQIIKASETATRNFVKHLRRAHDSAYSNFCFLTLAGIIRIAIICKKQTTGGKYSIRQQNKDETIIPADRRINKLSKAIISHKQFDDRIVNFIINIMSSLLIITVL